VVSQPGEPVEYRALDPRLQTWVAACLYYGTRDMIEKLHGAPDEATADALYAHCARFGTTLQMPAEAWPESREAFAEYWERSLSEVHIDAPVRDYLLQLTSLQHLHKPLRKLAAFNLFVTAGFLPPFFRKQMGLPWSQAHQTRFDALMRWVGRLERALPVGVRTWLFKALLHDMRRRRRNGRPLV
jgi:uncharacterized protein (DUF2236 family)